jgi:predicted transcriptional regulator
MVVVWAQSSHEPTVREVAQLFPDLAYTTVATMLDRLTEKGVARCRMERGTRRFAANGSRADYTAMYMYDTLRRTSETGEALARFADIVSPTEAKALRAALQRRQRSGPNR